MIRVFLALAVSLSLAFGAFFGVGFSTALAADGYNPSASDSPEVDYCYPSGYNRQGWRCGWRLAMAPYNLGDYNYYYGTGGQYWWYGTGGPYWWYGTGGPNWGTGGYPTNIADYGGRPRFGPYNYYGNYYNGYYYPCNIYNNPYCYGYTP